MKKYINSEFHKSLDQILEYAKKNTNIKKIVVFGNALNVDEPMGLNDEMHTAIYLNNPTEEEIIKTAQYIEENIGLVWACMIDDKSYDNNIILKQTIEKGVIVYG